MKFRKLLCQICFNATDILLTWTAYAAFFERIIYRYYMKMA